VRRAAAALLTIVALVAPGLAAAARPTGTVVVFAATSLTDAFQEIGKALERDHPGWRVRFNFAASNQLALQIENGAQADVFASADQPWMDFIAQHDRLTGNAEVFARNRMVAIVPRTNPARISSLHDFGKRGVKLVLAGEAVPAGKYARQVLRNLSRQPGYGQDFARRVLGNMVSEEENVRAVVTKVQLGEADAGFCYVSDTVGLVARDLRMFPIPDSLDVTADDPIAVLKAAPAPALARAFMERVLSPEGQRILARAGFIPVAR